jgi:adenylate cyclase
MNESPREAVPQEIERKFKVKYLPKEIENMIGVSIDQGYLADGRRYRHKGDKYYLTIKRGTGLVREEFEEEITEAEFNSVWADTEGARLSKTRYKIKLSGDCVAELDIYSGDLEGRMVVEVEFADIDLAMTFEPPDWFGEDITEASGFSNIDLAKQGWPEDLK